MIYNLEGEYTALSDAITKKKSLDKLMGYHEGLFTNKNIKIFNALKELYEDNELIDSVIVMTKLKSMGSKIEEYELAEILKYNTINIDLILKDLERKYFLRKIYKKAEKLQNSIKESPMNAEQFLDEIIKISAVFFERENTDFCHLNELKNKSLKEIFPKNSYYKTGLQNLDDVITGLFNGQLIVIAGRQKKGKTTFAIQIAKNINKNILFFSLEMKREEILSKIIAGDCNVEAWKIEIDQLAEYEKNAVQKVFENYNYDIILYDGNMNFNQMKNVIKKKAKGPVFIDYLQLIKGVIAENQNLRIDSMVRDLKLLAHELELPIILLSQLNRDCEKNNRQPVSSDLRDSGGIEQHADIIIFVHEQDNVTQIIIGDNRKGKKGLVEGIEFIKKYSRFEDAKPSSFNDCKKF
jgi:replicative DNA helicase